MGWFIEHARGHEGYVIGLVRSETGETWGPDGERVRRLMTGDGAQAAGLVQVACDCGWRSRIFNAPLRAEFWPSTIDLNDDRAEARAHAIWKLHAETDSIDGGGL